MKQEWISFFKEQPEDGQKIYYYGDMIGVWSGTYRYSPDDIYSHHLIYNDSGAGFVDRMDAPWWMPFSDQKPEKPSQKYPDDYLSKRSVSMKTDRQNFIIAAALSYAFSNCEDLNVSFSECPYCGGSCLLYPNDGDSGCDGYLGDVDGLLADRNPEDRLEIRGTYGDSITESEIETILNMIMLKNDN
jgi:hypothetical protein